MKTLTKRVQILAEVHYDLESMSAKIVPLGMQEIPDDDDGDDVETETVVRRRSPRPYKVGRSLENIATCLSTHEKAVDAARGHTPPLNVYLDGELVWSPNMFGGPHKK